MLRGTTAASYWGTKPATSVLVKLKSRLITIALHNMAAPMLPTLLTIIGSEASMNICLCGPDTLAPAWTAFNKHYSTKDSKWQTANEEFSASVWLS